MDRHIGQYESDGSVQEEALLIGQLLKADSVSVHEKAAYAALQVSKQSHALPHPP